MSPLDPETAVLALVDSMELGSMKKARAKESLAEVVPYFWKLGEPGEPSYLVALVWAAGETTYRAFALRPEGSEGLSLWGKVFDVAPLPDASPDDDPDLHDDELMEDYVVALVIWNEWWRLNQWTVTWSEMALNDVSPG